MIDRATSALQPVSCSLTEIAHLPPTLFLPNSRPSPPCVMPQPVTFTGSPGGQQASQDIAEKPAFHSDPIFQEMG